MDDIRLIPAHAGKTWRQPRRAPGWTAHPRSRGENIAKALGQATGGGSSPLTRGKLEPLDDDAHGGRLIPAHAGKTHCAIDCHVSIPAHPRSRGENEAILKGSEVQAGSSPLTRGKRDALAPRVGDPGLIPAHAGKTKPAPSMRAPAKAHPRSRGENRWSDADALSSHGSSPLTRGKHLCPRWSDADARLIPAHAGKTPNAYQNQPEVKAHPRSRGENLLQVLSELVKRGSSPLTRGKLWPDGVPRGLNRLIPAHAGKTSTTTRGQLTTVAHPRSRGENLTDPSRHDQDPGSSPLTRGKRDLQRRLIRSVRLIPAHAGKTSLAWLVGAHTKAHPRSRGENRDRAMGCLLGQGSSPLTRGKRVIVVFGNVEVRLIPAHAGKTLPVTLKRGAITAHPRSRGENLGHVSAAKWNAGSSPLTRGKPAPGLCRGVRAGLIPAHAGKTSRAVWVSENRAAHPRSRGENPKTRSNSLLGPGSSPLTRGKR